MKKFLVFFITSFLSAAIIPPTIRQINSVSGNGTVTFTNAVLSGSSIVVVIGSESAVSGVTISDSLSTSYTRELLVSGVAFYIGTTGSAGSNTVTFNSAPNNFTFEYIAEVTGITSTVDASGSSVAHTSPFTINLTTTSLGGNIIFYMFWTQNNVNFTPSGGMINFPLPATSDSKYFGMYMTTGAATYTLTATTNNFTQTFAAIQFTSANPPPASFGGGPQPF